jgi:transposase
VLLKHLDQLTDSGSPRCISRAATVWRSADVQIAEDRFLYHYNEATFDYEPLLAGCCVLVTSLTPDQASSAPVAAAYRQLQEVEHRFQVLNDFLRLRPVRHWTERRVRGHITICVYAAVIEALIARQLADADMRDPDLPEQHVGCVRALRELHRIRDVTLTAGGHTISVVTRADPLQRTVLTALNIDTTGWDCAHLS